MRSRLVFLLAFLVLTGISAAALAQSRSYQSPSMRDRGEGPTALRMQWPVACTLGTNCFIQNYVDQDPSSNYADYSCGRLSFNGNTATDIRLLNRVQMRGGVNVLSAAQGHVFSVRDGVEELMNRGAAIGPDGAQPVWNDDGNSITIDHGNGWTTQYNHLLKGSILVQEGQLVDAGSIIAKAGMSGNTQFPNLEFTVRHWGAVVDPFIGVEPYRNCGEGRQPLWANNSPQNFAYQSTALLGAGLFGSRPQQVRPNSNFLPQMPNHQAAQQGAYSDTIASDSAALFLWAEVMGAKAGDEQHFQIFNPDNDLVHDWKGPIANDQAVWFGYSGMKPMGDRLRQGNYRGHYTLSRDGKEILQKDVTVFVD
jgi:murein DD-endopeptidase MepM/ murein hydrolase activator NlpD